MTLRQAEEERKKKEAEEEEEEEEKIRLQLEEEEERIRQELEEEEKARQQRAETETRAVEDIFKEVNKKSRRGSRRQSVDPGQFFSSVIQYFFSKCMKYGNAFYSSFQIPLLPLNLSCSFL